MTIAPPFRALTHAVSCRGDGRRPALRIMFLALALGAAGCVAMTDEESALEDGADDQGGARRPSSGIEVDGAHMVPMAR